MLTGTPLRSASLRTVIFADINTFSFERFTNGAMIQVREVFRRLAARGVGCGIVATADIAGARLRDGIHSADREWVLVDGVAALEVPLAGSSEAEPDRHFVALCTTLECIKPDLVMVNTPPIVLGLAETLFFEWLAQQRYTVLCFVPDANFPSARSSPPKRLARLHAALSRMTLAAPSTFIAGRVNREFNLPVRHFPNLFDANRIVAQQEQPTNEKRVTFVNPHPMKGLAIMDALAEARPDLSFQYVKSWPYPPMFTSHRSNVETIVFDPDMRGIWARTSLLAVPSLCLEAFGRVVVEAQLNGIPVIHHNIGGLGEAACGVGVALLPPPFHGSPTFPKVTPNDLSEAVHRWSSAIDYVMSATPDSMAIRAAGHKYRYLADSAFADWVATFATPEHRPPILALAPHCDDIAFSLAGVASRSGDQMVLATLFSQSGYTAAGGLAGNPCTVTPRRMAEDGKFARAVGARLDILPLPEAALRHHGDFDAVFLPHDNLGAAVQDEEPQVVERVEQALERLFAKYAPRAVLLPLGLGGHRDHMLARDTGFAVARRCGVPVAFYEDLPYAESCDDGDIRMRASRLGGATPLLSRFDPTTKLDLCRIYESQIDNENLSAIDRYGARIGGVERLWPLDADAALALSMLS